jgi:pyruvate dehydrogenase E2 component (dihydrolipoamide acetyltransferase)
MPIEILMPALSPTMTEGNLSKWLKKEGDKVVPGDVLAEIETDKATMEVEAVDAGTIGKILVTEGTEGVPVNQLIALLLEEGEDKAALAEYKSAESVKAVAAPVAAAPAAPAQVVALASASRVVASPLAKRIAANEGVDLQALTGTGPHGRIIRADVLDAKAAGTSSTKAAPVVTVGRNTSEVTKIPNTMMRKVIAKRLTESKQTVPHFYLNIECELDRLLAARSEINEAAGKEPAYKLSVNDFIIKAVAMALRTVPAANASWTDEAILQYNNIDISVAVAIEGGLITPIIKNADQKSLSVISNEMKDLAARAKAGKLAPEEFQGGGFSISNLGMFGIKNFNAIVNPPQGCILAIGAGSERAVVHKGHLVAATVMDATLSCDHRVVDGAVGAQFLAAFKKFVEHPVTMLV